MLIVNPILKIKTKYYSPLILGLIFLFLIAPCKVRNYIQAELGIPQTHVLNKSQTTISQSNCLTFEVSKPATATSKISLKFIDFFVAEKFSTLHLQSQLKNNNNLKISNSKRITTIPLYILYQNIKVYS